MKKFIGFFSVMGLLLFVAACNTNKRTDNPPKNYVLADMYEGELPCADCSGILTYVTFGPDSSIAVTSFYYGNDSTLFTDYGTYSLMDSLVTASLPSGTQYYVILSDSVISLADQNGKLPVSMADNYKLRKAKVMDASSFAGTYYWGGKSKSGYNQELKITRLAVNQVEVEISFSGAKKGCTFKGKGTIMNNQIEVPLNQTNVDFKSTMIIRPAGDNTLLVLTANNADRKDLHYFCGGGGSLAGTYERSND